MFRFVENTKKTRHRDFFRYKQPFEPLHRNPPITPKRILQISENVNGKVDSITDMKRANGIWTPDRMKETISNNCSFFIVLPLLLC